jgi:transcription initiation factor TFIIIB Brf1 subunit/transcription initiation factor TFIIB
LSERILRIDFYKERRKRQNLKCPECGGTIVSPQGLLGEKVCTNCGLVVRKTLVARHFSQWTPDWPSNWGEQDSDTLKQWLTALRTVSCQLNIPNFPYREEAARLIRKEKRLFFQSQRLAKNKRATAAALLQLILREYGKERSIKNICQQLSLNSKLVMKQTWNLKENIRNKKQFLLTQKKSSKDYLYAYGGKIANSKHLLLRAEECLAKIQKKGGNPISLAAGAFYHACKVEGYKITKNVIGKAFGVSDRTVDTNERKIRRLIASHKRIGPLPQYPNRYVY